MKKLTLPSTLIILSLFITQPVFSEEIPTDQKLLEQQLQEKLKTASPQELEKATSDPDLAALMKVMKLVENKSYKEAVPILENLVENPQGKGMTPQSIEMVKNLINVMKVMADQSQDGLVSP